MSPQGWSENHLVEQPAIGLFAELGWTTVSALDETFGAAGTLQRETKGDVVLEEPIGQPHPSRFPTPGTVNHR